jgi:hypothetical protein
MTLERCTDGSCRITFIGDAERRADYAAVGIPDALNPEASRVLDAPIRSSSNTDAKSGDEFPTLEADKMWKRLRLKGLACNVATQDSITSVTQPSLENIRRTSSQESSDFL